MSYTTTATLESRMYDGIRLLKRSWPAVSHSCSRTVLSSRYIVCAHGVRTLRCRRRVGLPTCLGEEVDADGGLVHVVERVVHEARNK